MRLVMIIKGDRFQAANAAGRRGIPMAYVRETGYGETIGHTPASFLDLVGAWFHEPAKVQKGRGYPPGTLLWFHTFGR